MLLTLACAILIAPAPDVVELKDGSRQVGEVRSRKGADVDLLTSLGLQHFDAGSVARVELRADQLPNYRVALATAGRQPHALVTLAQWCLDRGLYAEAFDCTDHALEADGAIASDLLARLANEAILDGAIPTAWPDVERRERLLERIAGKSPSRAAFASSLLAKAADEELLPWLVDELADQDPDVRVGAADLLGGVRSDKGLAKLIRASLIDANERVRDHARAAALRSGHPDLARPYLRALETDEAKLRERAYPALAELSDPRVVPALIHMFDPRPAKDPGSAGYTPPRAYISIGEQRAFVQDFDVQIAQGAVIAKPIIGVLQSGVVLDVAVAGVVVISHVERARVVQTLRKVSGRDFGDDPAAWARWWSLETGKLAAPTEKD